MESTVIENKKGMMKMTDVAVFGGGISGLTVAHECAEAGLSVVIYEKLSRCGGKAVGYRLPDGHAFAGWPVEHSLRAYTCSYGTLFEMMQRIPAPAGTVYDHVLPLPTVGFRDKSGTWHSLNNSTQIPIYQKASSFYKMMRGLGIRRRDILHFIVNVVRWAKRPEKTNLEKFAQQSFQEYIRLDSLEPAYRDFLISFASINVAARPESSALVVMDLFSVAMFASKIDYTGIGANFSVLDGPTSERFIEPWVDHLKNLGVRIMTDVGVQHIDYGQDRLKRVVLDDGSEVAAKSFVLALPHPVISSLLPELYRATPLRFLPSTTAWSNGF